MTTYQLEEIEFSTLNSETRIQPEFGAIRTKTLSEFEGDLEKLLEDIKQETPMEGKASSSNHTHSVKPSLWKKKSKTSFKKTTRIKKPSKDIFSNIDNIEEKIEHYLQVAEDTFNDGTSYEELSNPWALSPAEREQGQAFIKFLDIECFMEGLTNPDKLETLWEQSKAKKLWDDSQNKPSDKLD